MRAAMRLTSLLSVLLLPIAAACSNDSAGPAPCCSDGPPTLRVVNAFTGPVQVLVDGAVAIPSLEAGAVVAVDPAPGDHALELRPAGSGAAASRAITTAANALRTVAVVRGADGALAMAMLDDTNSVVPAGATKVRVLHLAPNAGTLQVYRTQPDHQQPVSWQFPFEYQAEPTSISAPFYQSTPGTWEIRVWQTPADAAGWASAPLKVTLPLAGGEKRTVMLLDAPGGGVRAEVM